MNVNRGKIYRSTNDVQEKMGAIIEKQNAFYCVLKNEKKLNPITRLSLVSVASMQLAQINARYMSALLADPHVKRAEVRSVRHFNDDEGLPIKEGECGSCGAGVEGFFSVCERCQCIVLWRGF